MIRPEFVATDALELISVLEPSDIEQIARAGTALSVFAGIGRALFTAREAAPAAPAAPRPRR